MSLCMVDTGSHAAAGKILDACYEAVEKLSAEISAAEEAVQDASDCNGRIPAISIGNCTTSWACS